MLSQADKGQKSVSESDPAEEIQIIRGSAGPVPATPQQLDTSSNTNDATERGESAAALQYELANSSVLTTIALRSVAVRRIIRPGRYDGSQSGQGRP
jgi:hypothetical protein